MKHTRAGILAALCGTALTAASAFAQAAAPFPVVPNPPEPHRSHFMANTMIVTGVLMIASSFLIEREADRTYDQYLSEIDPARITELYDRTTHYDDLSNAALIGGNVLLATGVTLRLLQRPHAPPVSLYIGAERCAVAFGF